MSGQLYPWGKTPWYPLDRRLGGSQSQSGRHGEEKILAPNRTRTPTPRSYSSQLIAIPTVRYPGSLYFVTTTLYNINLTENIFRCRNWENNVLYFSPAKCLLKSKVPAKLGLWKRAGWPILQYSSRVVSHEFGRSMKWWLADRSRNSTKNIWNFIFNKFA
jgi:hypothetical protein